MHLIQKRKKTPPCNHVHSSFLILTLSQPNFEGVVRLPLTLPKMGLGCRNPTLREL
jgi:hypothetical protein